MLEKVAGSIVQNRGKPNKLWQLWEKGWVYPVDNTHDFDKTNFQRTQQDDGNMGKWQSGWEDVKLCDKGNAGRKEHQIVQTAVAK